MLSNDPLAAPMGRLAAWGPVRIDHGRRWTGTAISTVALWVQRTRTRRALAALESHQLRDIGLSHADARRESAKPFWRA